MVLNSGGNKRSKRFGGVKTYVDEIRKSLKEMEKTILRRH